MSRFLLTAAALALAGIALASGPVHAQIVRGQVVEEASNTPVEGAMVVLLDLERRMVHRVLTDASGGFVLDADHPGPHFVRVDRIGYESVTTDRFDVPVDGTFRRVSVPIRPVELEGISVEGARRCEVRGQQGQSTATVWEEARKALEAAAWTLESGVYRYTLLNYERTLEPDARRLRAETRRFNRASGQAPYVSRPARELADEGFVRVNEDRTLSYYAPDAAAFLSDAFLDTHCMRLDDVRDGEVGLAFEPIRGRRLPDIAGTLWIDAASAQLRRLEFAYVNLPGDRDMGNAGGEVVFGRLPNGTWIVRDWWIRMPILATDVRRTRLILTGYTVQGGTVWRVTDRGGSTVVEAASASVSVSVVDSLGVEGLAGVRVRTDDGEVEAATGDAGTALLPGLAPGLQGLEVFHPSLDSLGLGPVHAEVEAVAGEITAARLRVPGVTEVLLATCGDTQPRDRETAVLLGRVRRGGVAAAGAPVRVRWLGGDREGFDVTDRAAPLLPEGGGPRWRNDPDDTRWLATTLDRRGIFVLCGVPTRTQVRVEAGGSDGEEARVVTLPAGQNVVITLLTLPEARDR